MYVRVFVACHMYQNSEPPNRVSVTLLLLQGVKCACLFRQGGGEETSSIANMEDLTMS